MTRLSVVIPVWNQGELLRSCLVSLRGALEDHPESEVIVVDDGSGAEVAEIALGEFPGLRLLQNDRNRGFAVSANRGMSAARGEFVLLLNSDTEVDADGLGQLLDFLADHPTYAGAVPRLVGADDRRVQKSCMAFPRFTTPVFFGTPLERWFPNSPELRRYFLRDFEHETERDVEQPPAACWLLRRATWEALGGFDESLELFFNDVDWCRRLADTPAKLRYLPGASVLHHGGASTRERTDFVECWQADRLRYQRKHFGRLGGFLVKLCVSWTYLDWCSGNLRRRLAGRAAEPAAPMRRAFLTFLRT